MTIFKQTLLCEFSTRKRKHNFMLLFRRLHSHLTWWWIRIWNSFMVIINLSNSWESIIEIMQFYLCPIKVMKYPERQFHLLASYKSFKICFSNRLISLPHKPNILLMDLGLNLCVYFILVEIQNRRWILKIIIISHNHVD